MVQLFKKIADSNLFNYSIIGVILAAGALVGVQTYSDFAAKHHDVISIIDKVILWIFVFEIVIKMGAEGKKPWNYFKDPWNIFDFSIVAICFIPMGDNMQFVTVLRLARILRVFKLVTALPRLQMIVGALLKSIPSMGYIFMLLLLHFYIYAAMATFFYSSNDPIHFGELPTSMLSLFRAVTLEDWTDLMYINMYGSDNYGYDVQMDQRVEDMGMVRESSDSPVGAAIFFVSFILTGSMIVLNLFIGVIMTGMEEMKAEAEMDEMVKRKESEDVALHEEVLMLEQQVQQLSKNLLVLNKRLQTMDTNSKQNGHSQVESDSQKVLN